MHPIRFWRVMSRWLPAAVAWGWAGPVPAQEPVAVLAQTFNGYVRTRLPDGSFKPEHYAFGEGGCWTRATDDPAMDKLKFVDVARVVAAPLRRLNYVPAQHSSETNLLILVFWGSTQGSQDYDPDLSIDRAGTAMSTYNSLKPVDNGPPSAAAKAAQGDMDSALWQLALLNEERDRIDERNARILGYTDALQRARFVSHMSFAQDILTEVGENRYYVVLQAYDFQTAMKEKKLRPLWIARISVSEHGAFADALNQMVWSASRYLGQDSKGLHRREPALEGKVEIGPMEVLEMDAAGQAKPGPEPSATPGK